MPTNPTTPPVTCPICHGSGYEPDPIYNPFATIPRSSDTLPQPCVCRTASEPPPAPRRDGEGIANAVQFRRLKPGDNFRFLHSSTPYEKKDGHGRYGTPGSEGHIAIAHPSAPVLPLEKENAPRRDGDAMPAEGDDLPRGYREVAFRFSPTDEERAAENHDGGEEYVLFREPRAVAGVIAFGKFRGEWVANCSDRAVIARLLSERDALAKRCEAAEKVVAKLPRTADGVPIVPGMEVWGDDCVALTVARVGVSGKRDGRRSCDLVTTTAGGMGSLDWSHLTYSTRAAAESAAQEGTVKP